MTLPRTTRSLSLGLLVGMLGSVVLLTPAHAAVTITPASNAIAAARDYASDQFSDPWDYSNGEDQNLTPNAVMYNIVNQRIANGVLAFDTLSGAAFDPIATIAGAEPTGRDSQLHPLNASKYRRLSFRMYSSSQQSAAILWFNCPNALPTCQGGFPFTARSGWNWYDFDVPATPKFSSAPVPWSGNLTGLRIIPTNNSGVHVEFDWLRIYEPGPGVTLNWHDSNPGNTVDLYWQNNDTQPGSGVFASVRSNTNNTTTFPSASFPPGNYTFYAIDSGTRSANSSTLNLDGPPLPVIDEPDITGGEDFASVTRGDPWDFSNTSDVGAFQNVQNVSFSGGVLHANNGPPNQNDPQVQMQLTQPIDGDRFHRLTFRMTYEGGFDLRDAPGGGSHARLIWNVQGTGLYQESREFVTMPNSGPVTYDLKRSPSTQINEEDQRQTKLGWAGRMIDGFRFDPNEDPGPRRWHLDDIKLAADDAGYGGFNIVFHDNNWEPGTRADIFVDSDRSGFNGLQIASNVAVNAGSNTYQWTAAYLQPGTYWIYVVLKDSRSSTPAYSTGPVRLSPVPIDAYPGFGGGVNVASGPIEAGGGDEIVTGAGAGGGPHVRIFRADGTPIGGFFAYSPGFTGGVNVAVGNVDGVPGDEIITGAGPGGGPHITVRRLDGSVIGSFFAYCSCFTGGVYVGAADVNGDGVDEIITGAGPGGGPHVRVLRLDGSEVSGFFAYCSCFTGGVRVAGGNIDGGSGEEIITGAGPGGGPHVRVVRAGGASVLDYFPYPSGFSGGVFVGAGDVDGNGRADVVTGAGAGGGAHVVVRSLEGAILVSTMAYPHSGGVHVAAGDMEGDRKAEVITGPGAVYPSHVFRFRPLI